MREHGDKTGMERRSLGGGMSGKKVRNWERAWAVWKVRMENVWNIVVNVPSIPVYVFFLGGSLAV